MTPITQALLRHHQEPTLAHDRHCKVGDALMRSGQVKPMLADVVQANTHINALIGFVVVQLYRLEGGPRTLLPLQVRPLLIERKAEHAREPIHRFERSRQIDVTAIPTTAATAFSEWPKQSDHDPKDAGGRERRKATRN
jgi:hypothetical protein